MRIQEPDHIKHHRAYRGFRILENTLSGKFWAEEIRGHGFIDAATSLDDVKAKIRNRDV